MRESITQQSLPKKEYRELLGTALCVFGSNNGFIIENIIKVDDYFSWHELIDKTSGRLRKDISKTISRKSGDTKIEDLFMEIVEMRNRIIHGFRITSEDGEQVIATKTHNNSGNNQFIITEEYLLEFIKKNEDLSVLLYDYRG